MRNFHFLNKPILATGWAIIIATLVALTFNPASSRASYSNADPEQVINSSIPGKTYRKFDKNELLCMAKNIYYEAGGESFIGKLAVGQVVLNRLINAGNLMTICGIVYEKSKDAAICQFSWVCDPKIPGIDQNSVAWKESSEVTNTLLALNTQVRDITNGATHFHAVTVHPSWADTLQKLVTVDRHIFYKKR